MTAIRWYAVGTVAFLFATGCASNDQDDLVADSTTPATDATDSGSDTNPTDTPPSGSPGASGNDPDSGTADSDSSSSDGGQPANRPPIIESPGLASDGLVLTIAPQVTDPEGDEVTLLFDVDGIEVDPAQTPEDGPTNAELMLNFADVGYRSNVPITITATDSRGATTRQTYSREVTALARVSFPTLELGFNDPEACLGAGSRELSFQLDLTGAIESSVSGGITVTDAYPSWRLIASMVEFYEGEEPPPLRVGLSMTLSGIGSLVFAAPKTYTSDADVSIDAFTGTSCEGALTYSIIYDVT
jgi:hypothetical protein